jgi:hypothetical protein
MNMFHRRKTILLFFIVILSITTLAIPSQVYAGGWVVITLDQLPAQIIAGQPYKLGMMARQHGHTPWNVPELQVQARQPESGQTINFLAKSDQKPGHYTVELVFPKSGRWEWGIQSGLYPTLQPMPALEVASNVSAAAARPRPNITLGLVGSLALLGLVAGLALLIRYRSQSRRRLTGIGLCILAGLLVVAFFSYANAKAGEVQPIPVNGTGPDMGQQLFLAKGCVVCHVNTRAIANAETYSVSIGPNLSAYHNDREYLRQFLANPKGSEATFIMPNLGLSATEIDALVRFLNNQPE